MGMLVLWMEENQKTYEKAVEQGQELTANSRMCQP